MCRLTCWIPPTPVSSGNSPIHIVSLALLRIPVYDRQNNISDDQEFIFCKCLSKEVEGRFLRSLTALPRSDSMVSKSAEVSRVKAESFVCGHSPPGLSAERISDQSPIAVAYSRLPSPLDRCVHLLLRIEHWCPLVSQTPNVRFPQTCYL
jgi:hypothetical protein